MTRPLIGTFKITRDACDVTRLGRIEPGDVVQAPFEQYVSRQIVAGRQLKDGEHFRLLLFGRWYDSREYELPWRLWSADRFNRKRPIGAEQFQADFEYVGNFGAQKTYRKRKPRWIFRYTRALAPALSLRIGEELRPLSNGDMVYMSPSGRFGTWPREWADRFVQRVTGNEAVLHPLADQIDKATDLFDEHAQHGSSIQVIRGGQDVSAERVILPGDTVIGPWAATMANADLVTVHSLGEGESVAGVTPWDALLESDSEGGSFELYPLADPTDWRIISATDLSERYLYVGQWGEHACYRQRVGTLAIKLSDEMGQWAVRSKETTGEPEKLSAGWCIVYDGQGGFYHWAPESAEKRKWVS